MSPDEWERFKKWAAIKPSDLNKGYYFKVESNNNSSGPYYWCNEHERLCKKFCKHVKKQLETKSSNRNSNMITKLEARFKELQTEVLKKVREKRKAIEGRKTVLDRYYVQADYALSFVDYALQFADSDDKALLGLYKTRPKNSYI